MRKTIFVILLTLMLIPISFAAGESDNTNWNITGGTGGSSSGTLHDIAVDSDNNFYMCGGMYVGSNRQYYVRKYTSTGGAGCG